MNTNSPDYQGYNQSNQGYNSEQSDSDKIFMLISLGAWLLVLVTGWICFAVPDIDLGADIDILVCWNYVIYATTKGVIDFPLYIYYILFYMILIITLLCLTAAFVVFAYSIFMKKDANVINGMLGNSAKFHFIPLACVSALFIIGETLDENHGIKGAHIFFNLLFTIIGLASLIFIYMQTKLESPSYAVWAIKDNKSFAEQNKSLMTGPKRNLYKEYAQDLNYYCEHFDIIKSRLKGKSQKEIREINNKITHEVTEFLDDIIKEEPDQIHQRILQIAKDIKENKLSRKDYEYLENTFQKSYDAFKKWKEEKVCDQEYRKVGKEWDDRFCYMHTFLGYFNKTRVENKELNKTNFEYLVNAIKKILELNENEDVDYNLCDLVVILSSTFYTADPKGKNGKKYINEVIKHCSIMQKQGFWVGLTRFELNEEIQQQSQIEDTLKEGNISEEKLNNSVIAKLMSVSYNIIQFVLDSNLFNRILYDIFKYCKINAENREIVVEMIDGQIQSDNLTHLNLDRDYLLSVPNTTSQEENAEKEKGPTNNNGET